MIPAMSRWLKLLIGLALALLVAWLAYGPLGQGNAYVDKLQQRADAVRETARKMGIETKSLYWTVGKYDVVATFEAPDDASITALSLAISSAGNVRTQTMRAFTKDEVTGILSKL